MYEIILHLLTAIGILKLENIKKYSLLFHIYKYKIF